MSTNVFKQIIPLNTIWEMSLKERQGINQKMLEPVFWSCRDPTTPGYFFFLLKTSRGGIVSSDVSQVSHRKSETRDMPGYEGRQEVGNEKNCKVTGW